MGCQSPSSAVERVPALLNSADAEARAEIATAISAALGGVPVTLSPTIFTRSSHLFIDQGVLRNGQSRVLDGKRALSPKRFELLSSRGACFLSGPDEVTVTRLNTVRCEAVNPR